MASAKIFRINYKSDFILTLESDAGWMTPFCIKFWTGAPSQAYFVGWDGDTYDHCSFDPSEPTKLQVQFDDHHLPIGDLKYQVAYHFNVADFPNDTEDEVINAANITTEIDGETYQVMLDFTGETAPEIQFALPAYANEAQRIANEQQRIANETQRIANEETRIQHEQQRIAAEQTRQQNEQQRINQEQARVNEYATLKADAVAATGAANDAAALANQKAQLAADKAALAQAAADLANAKAQLAADKAALAASAAQLANDKAALAQQKAEYAQTQGGYAKDQGDYAKDQGDYAKAKGDYAKDQGDYAKDQGDYAKDKGDICAEDHQTAVADHQTAVADHQTAQSDHTTAGNDHTTAQSDHTTASNDHTQAGNDHTRAESDHTRAESDHAAVEVYVDSLGVFDLSKHNAVGGVLATYADLSAALTALNALDSKYKYGGMSFKFVHTSDNKYVQYRLMSQTWSTNIDDWSFCGNDVYVENPEFVEVKLDSNGRILWAIKTDGTVFFGAGVPPQVVEELATKVDKIPGKGLSTNDFTNDEKDAVDCNNLIENTEFLQLEVDSDNKVLGGRKVDGTKFENMPFELQGAKIYHIDNSEWIKILVDSQDKIIAGVKADGSVYIYNIEGVTSAIREIQETVDVLEEEVNRISKKNIRLLVFGNSLTQDAINYVPWMLNKLCPDIKFTIVDYYVGGATLAQQLEILNGGSPGGKTAAVYYSDSDNFKWLDVTSSKDTILAQGFDHITIQEYTNNVSDTLDSASYLGVIQKLQEICGPAKFHHLLDKTLTGNASLPNKAINLAETAYKTMPVSTIVNPGMAFDNAYNNPTLNAVITGDPTYEDTTHAEEGLPCYIEALVMVQWIFGLLNVQKSIMDDTILLNATEYAKIGVTGPNVGSNGPIYGTNDNQRLAQRIAVQTYKQSFDMETMN